MQFVEQNPEDRNPNLSNLGFFLPIHFIPVSYLLLCVCGFCECVCGFCDSLNVLCMLLCEKSDLQCYMFQITALDSRVIESGPKLVSFRCLGTFKYRVCGCFSFDS